MRTFNKKLSSYCLAALLATSNMTYVSQRPGNGLQHC